MPAIGPYNDYVEHPRFGRAPRITGLNESESCWRYRSETIIENTGVRANLHLQNSTISPLCIYYDLDKVCRDCGLSFLFFAIEQQYWYEKLRFPIDADCVRCPKCRKSDRRDRQLKSQYDLLVVISAVDRTWQQNLELVELSIQLTQRGVLGFRSFDHARECLNAIPKSERYRMRYRSAREAIAVLEADL